jgi:hypothetical protein
MGLPPPPLRGERYDVSTYRGILLVEVVSLHLPHAKALPARSKRETLLMGLDGQRYDIEHGARAV